MSAGASARSRVALTTLFGAWLASCSADVDGYHLDPDIFANKGGSTAEGGAAGAVGGGSGTPNSASGGESGAGNGAAGGIKPFFPLDAGTGGSEGGAAGATDTGGADNGGTGSGGAETGGMGTGGIGTGGTGNGGAANGGTGSGGKGAGGAGTGGTGAGGAGAGGAGTGGTGAGGAGTGGTGTGGTGTGGTGAGGTGTGGTGTGGTGAGGAGTVGSSNPVWVTTTGSALANITAAAWRPEVHLFYLLDAKDNRFYTLDVNTAVVSAPRSLPAGTVASHAFGASTTYVYVVINNSIYRVPVAGSTSVGPVTALGDTPLDTALSGAYANGWFFLGEANGSAHALLDGQNTLDASVSSNKNINNVSTDGQSSFVFRAVIPASTHVGAYLMPATAPLTRSGTPCDVGTSLAALGIETSVLGNRVAWVQSLSSGPYYLHSTTFSGGVCDTASITAAPFGTIPTGAPIPGIIDDQFALVVSGLAAGFADITLLAFDGSQSLTVSSVGLGAKPATRFVMGPPHHAILLSDNVPALISY